MNTISRRRCFLAAIALAAGCSLASMLPQPAHAEISICRHDPLVYLSNGDRLDLTDQIGDSPSNLKHISYTLHAPAGTRVIKVIYATGMKQIASFRFYTDQPRHTYKASTVVSTRQGSRAVVTFTGLLMVPKHQFASARVSGTVGKVLEVKFR